MTMLRISTVLAAVVALTACGGGGGSAPMVDIPTGVRSGAATAGADINADNAAGFAGPLARAALTGASGSLLDPTGGTTARPSAATGRAASGAATPTLVGATLMHWLGHLSAGQPAAASRRHALAVQTEVLPCAVSGTLRVSFDDADNDQDISAGDVIGFLAAACVEDPALPAINGGFTMTVNAVTLGGDGEPTALDVSASFQDFTLAGYGTLNGAFRLWTRQETAASVRLRISYLGTRVSEPAGAAVYDFDIDGLANAATGSFEVGGGFGLGGQTYAISTATRLGYAVDASPSSGELRLRDAAGDEVRLLARSALSFDLAFWPAGAAQPSLVLNDLRWADYTD